MSGLSMDGFIDRDALVAAAQDAMTARLQWRSIYWASGELHEDAVHALAAAATERLVPALAQQIADALRVHHRTLAAILTESGLPTGIDDMASMDAYADIADAISRIEGS